MRTFMNRLAGVNDKAWDVMLGIDTYGEDCQPTAYHVLRKLLAKVPMQPDDSFVDIGCGKGRVLCLAAQQPIARAQGIEITPEHATAAKRNLERLKGKKAKEINVMLGSATDFDYAGGSVFYLYNPFGGDLFGQVVSNIRDGVKRGKRPVRVVYVNPVCRDVLDKSDWLKAPEVIFVDRAGREAALLYHSR
jgi:SAM-dependent methyltransferase